MNSSSPFLFIRANISKIAGDPQEMGNFVNSCGWVVASPPRRCGPHRQGDDATVYTSAQKWRREPIFADLCTLLRPHVCPQRRDSVHKCPSPQPATHGKAHSGGVTLTERRILDGRRHGKAHSACEPHQKAYSASERSRRMRFYVRRRVQTALLRETVCAECAFA